VAGYHPMTLAELGGRLAQTPDAKVRWKLVWEFLEEYRWAWFPAQLQIPRTEALVWAPAAFRKHGVYLSVRDLNAA
jgi:hypothetical protein